MRILLQTALLQQNLHSLISSAQNPDMRRSVADASGMSSLTLNRLTGGNAALIHNIQYLHFLLASSFSQRDYSSPSSSISRRTFSSQERIAASVRSISSSRDQPSRS